MALSTPCHNACCPSSPARPAQGVRSRSVLGMGLQGESRAAAAPVRARVVMPMAVTSGRRAKRTSEPKDVDSSTTDKKKALDATLANIDATFGKGSIFTMGSAAAAKLDTFSSGAISLDMALGGGWPVGRILEVFGPESSGKTTLALHAIAAVQKKGGTAALIDAEHAFDPVYAESLGVNVDELVMCQPDHGEMALEVVDQLVRSMAVELIVVDSVAALVPQAEIEGEIGMIQVGAQARLMSQALRKLATNASKCNCSVFFINQLRQKIGVVYGSPEVTTGGQALKFYSSVRADIRRIARIKGDNNEDAGIRCRVKVVKNKVARPFRQTELDLMFGSGFSSTSSLLECAEEMGFVTRKGSWYSYGEERMGQGREQAMKFLGDNVEACRKLEDEVRKGALVDNHAVEDRDQIEESNIVDLA